MNELTNLEHFCNNFHDGEVFLIVYTDLQLKIFIESSPLFFSDEKVSERDKKLILTSEKTLKGLINVKRYKKITINGSAVDFIQNDFDYCEVLDLNLSTDSIELNLNMLTYPNNNLKIEFCKIMITGCEYEWVNFNKIKESEYPGDKDDFFGNIRELMDQSRPPDPM